MNVLENWLTVCQVADDLGLTTGRIRQMLRDKTLEGTKVGPRLWMVSRDELQRIKSLPRKRGRKPSADTNT